MSEYANRRNDPRYVWPAAPEPGPFYRKETSVTSRLVVLWEDCDPREWVWFRIHPDTHRFSVVGNKAMIGATRYEPSGWTLTREHDGSAGILERVEAEVYVPVERTGAAS